MNVSLDKYSGSVLDNFDDNNMLKIIGFLRDYCCDCIDDLLMDYMDLFTIPYAEFVSKFHKLNAKYDNCFLAGRMMLTLILWFIIDNLDHA